MIWRNIIAIMLVILVRSAKAVSSDDSSEQEYDSLYDSRGKYNKFD